ncbi:unnamed protein product [Peniophora sp. CBMAI 1063]|nr:unnamed protein product [Peniophora sp. CBMAI 1063]
MTSSWLGAIFPPTELEKCALRKAMRMISAAGSHTAALSKDSTTQMSWCRSGVSVVSSNAREQVAFANVNLDKKDEEKDDGNPAPRRRRGKDRETVSKTASCNYESLLKRILRRATKEKVGSFLAANPFRSSLRRRKPALRPCD